MLTVERSEKIDPETISIPDRLRKMNDDKVVHLMESMREIGQITPIQIRMVGDGEDVVLVAGRHRVEAAIRLGWDKILANFVYGTDDEFRLWEIAENLHRSELTPLERSEHIAEWVRLTDKHMQSGQIAQIEGVADNVAQLAPLQKEGRGRKSGIRDASRTLGVERTDVQRSVKIDSISPEAKQAARETGLDRNQSALLRVATASPETQVVMVHRIIEEKSEKPKQDHADEFAVLLLQHVPADLIPTVLSYLDEVSSVALKKAIVKAR